MLSTPAFFILTPTQVPVLNKELRNIEVWLRCNKLSVNVKKTTYITFKPWQKKCNQNFSISLGDQFLTQTNATSLLGVYIDEHLTSIISVTYVNRSLSQLKVPPVSNSRFKSLTDLVLLANLSLYHLLQLTPHGCPHT